MARVLILSLVFPPDNVSTAQLMGEIAVDLRAAGHDVRVVSTVPHYHPDAADRNTHRLRQRWGRLVQASEFAGISVMHVWMPRKGRNLLVRAAAWCGFHLLSTLLACTSRWKPDVVLAPSPPLTIGVSAWLVCVARRARYVYNIQEIYPDVAIHLGVLRSRWAIWLWTKLEHFVYRRAALLTTISPSMQRRIVTKGVLAEKVRLVPNFVDLRTFECSPRENDFARRHALTNKFVLCYAGNMGKPQGLDVFVEAMTYLKDRSDVHLLMVGGGSEYQALKEMALAARLTNTTFLPQQDYSVVPQIYGCANLSIVAQAPGTHADGIPSKVYRIMGSRRAVFAYTSEGSDLAWLVREADAGLVTHATTAVELAAVIRAAADKRTAWDAAGERGYIYVAEHFARARITALYAQIADEVFAARPAAGRTEP